MRAFMQAIHHPDFMPESNPESKRLSDAQRRLPRLLSKQHRLIARDMYSVRYWGEGELEKRKAEIEEAFADPYQLGWSEYEYAQPGDFVAKDLSDMALLYRVEVHEREGNEVYDIVADAMFPSDRSIILRAGCLFVARHPIGDVGGNLVTNPIIGEAFIPWQIAEMGQRMKPVIHIIESTDPSGQLLKSILLDPQRIP